MLRLVFQRVMPAQFTSPRAAAERGRGAEVSWRDAGLGEGLNGKFCNDYVKLILTGWN